MIRIAKTILVSTDFSQASELGIEAAAVLGRQNDADVVLVHVHTPAPNEDLVTDPDTGLLFPGAEARARLHSQLQQIADTKLAGLRVKIGIMASRAVAEGICAYASHVDADLVVLATHGRSGTLRLLIGSVAEAVVRQAPCPVLTLRSKAKR